MRVFRTGLYALNHSFDDNNYGSASGKNEFMWMWRVHESVAMKRTRERAKHYC